MDRKIVEMLKYGEKTMVEWIFNEIREVPDEWKKAIIVPIHKAKGGKDMCNDYRGISLLSIPGTLYGRVLMERL